MIKISLLYKDMHIAHSFLKVGSGKGITNYLKIDIFKTDKSLAMKIFQIAKFKHEKMDTIAIYRSYVLNFSNILQDLTKLNNLIVYISYSSI